MQSRQFFSFLLVLADHFYSLKNKLKTRYEGLCSFNTEKDYKWQPHLSNLMIILYSKKWISKSESQIDERTNLYERITIIKVLG